jgi:hypothetical protein
MSGWGAQGANKSGGRGRGGSDERRAQRAMAHGARGGGGGAGDLEPGVSERQCSSARCGL